MREKPTFVLFPSQIDSAYYEPIIEAALASAERLGFNLYICSGRVYNSPFSNEKQENVIYHMVDQKKIDGIIVFSGIVFSYFNEAEIQEFLSHFSDIPVISISFEIDGVYSITIDNKTGIKEIVRHLIQTHHYRRIAFLKGIEGHVEGDLRFQAYLETLEEQGIPFDNNLVVQGWFDNASGVNAVKTLLDERMEAFDALVCANDDMAIGAYDELGRRGFTIPDDFAVTGFDGTEHGQFSIPPLTSVEQDSYSCTVTAFDWLYDIKTKQERDIKKKVIPTKTLIRQSCGCLSGNDHSAELATSKRISVTAIAEILELDGKDRKLMAPKFKLLLERFHVFLKNRDSRPFLSLLNQLLSIIIIQKKKTLNIVAINQLHLLFLNECHNADEKERMNSLFRQINQIYSNIVNIKWGHHITAQKGINMSFRALLNNVSSIKSNRELFLRISDLISSFKIDQCIITFYLDDPVKQISLAQWNIPEQSQIVFSLDKDRKVIYDKDNGPIHNTRDFISRHSPVASSNLYTWIVRPLYVQDYHFGLIFFNGAPIDVQYYVNLHEVISTGLMSIYLRDELNKKALDLEMSNSKLTELDGMKTDFIQNITHEFRSPLTVIMSSADLAIKYDEIPDGPAKERFTIIYAAALRLKDAIDKLLDLAKMDSKGLELSIQQMDLPGFLNEILDYYQSAAGLSHIKIEAEIPQSINSEDFYCDKEKLEDILHNLFSNSLKFSDQEKGKIKIKLEDKKDRFLISIADNGEGIEPHSLELIFDRFVQSSSGRNSRYKGTGIGLSFAKQLTSLLKGKIWAESEGKGKGATFFLCLPKGRNIHPEELIKDSPSSESIGEKRANYQRILENEIQQLKETSGPLNVSIGERNRFGEFDIGKAVILIVEDNYDIARIEKEYLIKSGFRNFLIAGDGLLGLDAVYRYHPDIIISDYNMPNLRGDQFHNQISSHPDFSFTPFIFLTAINDQSLIQDRKEKGALEFLTKPIDENDFTVTVNLHLKRIFELRKKIYNAAIDPLTGHNNRQDILTELKRRTAERKYQDLSLIFFDLDHFKKINDTYGHSSGDAVLRIVGEITKEIMRSYDTAGRIGGEEFLLILPETNIRQGGNVAEKLRKKFEETGIETERGTLHFTASFGVSSLIDNSSELEKRLGIDSLKDLYTIDDPEKADWKAIDRIKEKIPDILIQLSDIALYQAKRNSCLQCSGKDFADSTCPACGSSNIAFGRNRVMLFGG